MNDRVYLDWNATTPVRPEAKAAMLEAMDLIGNPSSVHTEGRSAKALVEKARAQVAQAMGCQPSEVVFTSGATESVALAVAQADQFYCSEVEHEAVSAWAAENLSVDKNGCVIGFDNSDTPPQKGARDLIAIQLANGETGAIQSLPEWTRRELLLRDITQAFGKMPFSFSWSGADYAVASVHKIGGPKGVGVLITKSGTDVAAQLRGGGQEMGRRSGTENIIGIAGFGAAAEAAMRDLEAGVWDRISEFRNILENMLAESSKETIFIGKDARRLPNTTCFATPGWKGETQVMQMDLAGFAVSAGSACSSGKVRESRVLKAMGYPSEIASSAIRVSLGPTTTESEIRAFAEAWSAALNKRKTRTE